MSVGDVVVVVGFCCWRKGSGGCWVFMQRLKGSSASKAPPCGYFPRALSDARTKRKAQFFLVERSRLVICDVSKMQETSPND